MILKLVPMPKRCHVNIGFIVLVSCPGWSFIVLVRFADLNCEWMNPSKTLMCQGIIEIKGRMKILDMPIMLKGIVKGEVQVGVEDSHFHGLSMDYFHLHHHLVQMPMETVLTQKETEYSRRSVVYFMCCIAFVQRKLPIKRYNVDIIGFDFLHHFVFAKFRAPLLYFLQLLPTNVVCIYLMLVVYFMNLYYIGKYVYFLSWLSNLLLLKFNFLGHDSRIALAWFTDVFEFRHWSKTKLYLMNLNTLVLFELFSY